MRHGISVDFLNKTGSVESFLKAKYAIRYDREKRMIAKNDVVVLNVDGDTLRTEELTWEESTQRVHSNKFVRITTKTEIIMGDGFESDITFKNPKIYKIRGIVNLK
jgi:LPS export ABC transporter protein LptC